MPCGVFFLGRGLGKKCGERAAFRGQLLGTAFLDLLADDSDPGARDNPRALRRAWDADDLDTVFFQNEIFLIDANQFGHRSKCP